MTVVCGTDLSDGARPGVEAAAALAARLRDPALVLVHAIEPSAPGGDDPELSRARAGSLLAAEAAALGGRWALPAVRAEVREGSAAGELSCVAEREGAALTVVSSRGHGAAPLHRLGGTSERVAVECRAPVLVVRDAGPFEAWARGDHPLRLVLGIDFTETTDGAVALARRLRAAGPVDVVVVHVYFPGVSSRYGLEPLGPADEGGSLEDLVALDMAARVGPLRGEGAVRQRPVLGAGRIGDHVLAAAAEERADLVVVGTHRRRGYRRLAAISSVVLHGCRSSVCCVPGRGAAPAG